jgi:hypothetical protein
MNLFPILADPRNLVAQSGVTSKLQILCIFLATSGTAVAQSPSPEQLDLGAAKEFAVLGSSTVTNTGDTVLSGKYGVSPGSAVTGENEITGSRSTLEEANAARASAQSVYTAVQSATAAETTFAGAYDLGGMTLTPGVYTFASSAFLTGDLTLDFQGDPDAVFLFQIASTLITAAGPGAASVTIANDGTPQNVYWQVGSSATISTYTEFAGNIIAQASITLNTGANVDGRAIALVGAVTMDNNRVNSYSSYAPPSYDPNNIPSLPGAPAIPLSILIGLSLVFCLRGYFKKQTS